MKKNPSHQTVLLDESVNGLSLKMGDTAVDATAGTGGHAEKIANAIGKRGTLMLLDVDENSLSRSRERLHDAPAKLIVVQGNFRNLEALAHDAGVEHAEGILFDLGWHSEQLAAGRGLSFKANEPLDMRLGIPTTLTADVERGEWAQAHSRAEDGRKSRGASSRSLTAKDIIADWDEEEIATMIRAYGEERFAGRIARAIVESRKKEPIETSLQLAAVISKAVPSFYRNGRIHPATRTFQALRIAVNDELNALTDALSDALKLLAPGGRLAVISFHSLEDRIVKQAFRTAEDEGLGVRITKKPITPAETERAQNPRARSAKLRIFEKNHEKK